MFNHEPTEYRLIHPVTRKTLPGVGTLETKKDVNTLAKENAQGYGVFAVINALNLAEVGSRNAQGRAARDEDVTAVRAVWVELDKAETTPGAHLAMLKGAPLPPSLIVRSSLPHKLHAYWLMADCPVSEFTRIQKALAARFGGDPTVCNPARVMRVPGFLHTKGEPILTEILEVSA